MGQAEDLRRRSGLLVPLQEAFRNCIVVEFDLDTGGCLVPSGGDCTAAENAQGIPGANLHLKLAVPVFRLLIFVVAFSRRFLLF